MSFCFFVNWIVNYGITRATPNMITTMGWGIFLMYAMLTYLGTAFIWLCLPETKVKAPHARQRFDFTNVFQGRSIEAMDDLFKHPLWMMWKYAYPKEEDKTRKDVQGGKAEMFGEGEIDEERKVASVSEHRER
jgi:hypothetical protein